MRCIYFGRANRPTVAETRTHGSPPYRIAAVHGGPGATGEVAPIARELATWAGVLEPVQSESSVQGQVDELAEELANAATPPVALVGHSWGAWLGGLVATEYPELVRKLVLVGSPPFEASFVPEIMETRVARLTEPEREEFRAAIDVLDGETDGDEERAMDVLGSLVETTDSYDPMAEHAATSERREEIYRAVWPEAAAMRARGELLERFGEISCPVVAIHGDADPHPAAGVREPLSRVVEEFEFVLLQRCGHEPWVEAHARESFFETLRDELDETLRDELGG